MNRNDISMQKVRQLIMGTFSKNYATSNENVKAHEKTELHFRCFVFRSSAEIDQIDFSSIFLVLCVSSYTDVKNLSWKSNLLSACTCIIQTIKDRLFQRFTPVRTHGEKS